MKYWIGITIVSLIFLGTSGDYGILNLFPEPNGNDWPHLIASGMIEKDKYRIIKVDDEGRVIISPESFSGPIPQIDVDGLIKCSEALYVNTGASGGYIDDGDEPADPTSD